MTLKFERHRLGAEAYLLLIEPQMDSDWASWILDAIATKGRNDAPENRECPRDRVTHLLLTD